MLPRQARAETVLTDATMVLPDRVVRGTLHVVDGLIAAIDDARSHLPGAIALDGDFLIPGLVDLHTDNLERQVQPRVLARWPSRSAYLAHDAHCAAAGITTVLDALCAGDLGYEAGRVQTLLDALDDALHLAALGLLRSEHQFHVRCELAAPDMLGFLTRALAHGPVRMISLMDHTPGFGQYADLDHFRALRRADPMQDDEIDALIARLHESRDRWRGPNRQAVLDQAGGTGAVLASHDDETVSEVAENHALGIRVSEFPVRRAAAAAARALGMEVIAGAPNLVRGGSHSGNVAVADLLGAGLVDALASDYVPASLIECAFRDGTDPILLPRAVALVTEGPARIARFADRGRLAPGLRADLVRVHTPHAEPRLPIIRRVWREGAVIA